MFLTEKELQVRFQECLKFAKEIDIATAWATLSRALETLGKVAKIPTIRLRAIVGISNNATHPDALERLNEIGQLRLVDGNAPMFHPKVYIFRGPKKSVAWIGSANFTRGGFERNEETVFETEDMDTIVEWFDARWDKCRKLQQNDLDDYRKRWKLHPPSKEFVDVIGSSSMTTDKSPGRRPDNWKPLSSFEKVKANPFPTKIRFRGEDICDEWAEREGEAWGKMFVCIADWLVREGRMTKDDCPVEITGNGPGGNPFLCVATDRSQLPKRKLLQISGGMWVAVPQAPYWRAQRAKQLLEKFNVSPNKVELRMSE